MLLAGVVIRATKLCNMQSNNVSRQFAGNVARITGPLMSLSSFQLHCSLRSLLEKTLNESASNVLLRELFFGETVFWHLLSKSWLPFAKQVELPPPSPVLSRLLQSCSFPEQLIGNQV